MSLLYRAEAPGDWGTMLAPAGGGIGISQLAVDGRHDIFYRYWHAGGNATLLILHGLGAHSGWFIDMGNAIAALGINVYAMDHHGFGRSGGERGDTQRVQTYLEDIDRMVSIIHQNLPGNAVFPLGHSMGGVFAIHYAAAHQDRLGGVILLNPWIADTTKLAPGTVLAILVGGMLNQKTLVRLPETRKTTGMTTNPHAVELLSDDPHWVDTLTRRFYLKITSMRGATLARAKQITIPALVLQGEADVTVVPAATKRAFDALASTDKTYTTYPGYEHDAEFQADRSAMDQDIVKWMQAHSKS